MRSFYTDLGISRAASSRQIKAAYRALVKRLHPDLNPQTPATAVRLAKVNAAYAVLGHRERRAAYDIELAQSRRLMRQRLVGQGAIAVFTFAVAFSAIMFVLPRIFRDMPRSVDAANDHPAPPPALSRLSLLDAVRLRRGETHGRSAPTFPPLHESEFDTKPPFRTPIVTRSNERPKGRTAGRARPPDAAMSARRRTPPRLVAENAAREPPPVPDRAATPAPKSVPGQEPAPRQRAVAMLGATESVAASKRTSVAWTSFGAARLGFKFRYPVSHFPTVRWSQNARDLIVVSRDGRAVIRVRTEGRGGAESLAMIRRRLLAGRYARAELAEVDLSDGELTVAGRLGGEVFFERVVLACDRSLVRSFLAVYPRTEEAHFRPLISATTAGLRMGGASGAACPQR